MPCGDYNDKKWGKVIILCLAGGKYVSSVVCGEVSDIYNLFRST
jgi:hypothetical protein